MIRWHETGTHARGCIGLIWWKAQRSLHPGEAFRTSDMKRMYHCDDSKTRKLGTVPRRGSLSNWLVQKERKANSILWIEPYELVTGGAERRRPKSNVVSESRIKMRCQGRGQRDGWWSSRGFNQVRFGCGGTAAGTAVALRTNIDWRGGHHVWWKFWDGTENCTKPRHEVNHIYDPKYLRWCWPSNGDSVMNIFDRFTINCKMLSYKERRWPTLGVLTHSSSDFELKQPTKWDCTHRLGRFYRRRNDRQYP